MSNLIEVKPLREAFLASGLSANEIARKAGFVRTIADQTQLKRLLGLRHYKQAGDPRALYKQRISYKNACKIADALEMEMDLLSLTEE